EVDYQPGLSSEQLLAAVTEADALVVRGGTHVDEAVFQAARKLKVVGRAGVGTDNMDLAAANRKGVVIMHSPFGSATTTAEHTLALIMALARQIAAASASTKSGRWESERFLGVELTGKTLGLVGAGKVGRLVIERALALKMLPIVHDPYLSVETIRMYGAEPVDFDELLERADFITLHVPLTSETANLLNADTLARVKPGCRIVNSATGGLVDEAALAEAIRDGHVAGAAIDVFTKEPPDPDNPLLALDQVICTPHLRTATLDAQVNVTVQVARQIVDFLQRGVIVNAVNVPSISTELLDTLRPYIALAETLGSFQAQLYAHKLEEVRLEYAGAVTAFPTEALTTAALKGLLTPMVGSEANYINAPYLAGERGIRVIETKSPRTEGYASLIRLTVSGSDGEHFVCGALFGEEDFRIVRVDGYNVEAVPKGHILVLHNEDRPGMVGFIGQVLGSAGINIAMMNLSRHKINGKAISLVNIDSRIPDELLEELRSHPSILAVRQIEL
ncbi:MAG: phosphoglycerate dehydrogenase, partial [Desulfuromonadales bacterium]